MNHFKIPAISGRLVSALVIFSFFHYSQALAEQITVPANTRVYVETKERVSGKKKHTSEGQIVRAGVWRDVVVDGRTAIEAGTPVLVRVDSLKGAKIAGIKGKMSLGAYETTLVDDTTVQLSGGYFKEGKGRIALAASLGWLLFFPIFIKGKAADVPNGTVFDAYLDHNTVVDLADLPQAPRLVDLSGVLDDGFAVEVLYDELEGVEKPEFFAFSIRSPAAGSGEFSIDTVNGEGIKPIQVSATTEGMDGEVELYRGEVPIKTLAKQFRKGINTFEMATMVDGNRVAQEIVLDIQF